MGTVDVHYDGLRTWQSQVLCELSRFNVLVVHRRAGKTVLAILWLIREVAKRPGSKGCYLAPQYNQAKRVAWEYVRRFAGVIPGSVFNESELKAVLPNGSCLYLLGADNPDAIRGIGLDAAVLDEVAQMPSRAWREVVRPALADRKGSAMFIGTPFGMLNEFYSLYQQAESTEGWYRTLLRVGDTGSIDPEEVKALKAEMSEEEFRQEFECDWSAAVRGAYFGMEMAAAERGNRVTRVPFDPVLRVHTSWDLGIADTTVIWCWQVAGSEVRAINCLSFQSTSLPEIVRELKTLPYLWDCHYLPHDVKVRELGTGRSRLEILHSLGVSAEVVPDIGLRDGIEALRTLIPRVWFDAENCREGVEALKTYRTEWNDKTRVFRLQPLHSWESHYADAARMFAVGSQGRRDWEPLKYPTRIVA